jgi:hypothetical protein
VAGLGYADAGLARGESYFYMVTAVDAHGDESARSAAAAASIAGTQNQEDAGPGGGGGGGCFIGAALERAPGLLPPLAVMALLLCLLLLGRKRKE